MKRTLLTGATGTLGSVLHDRLRAAGHDVRPASRSPPGDDQWVELDLSASRGVREAVADVDVVVHAASAPQGATEAVDVQGTRQLLDAAEAAGVEHFLYISIVGIDEIPYSYYQHKLAAEEAIEASSVPSTILRATQFHQFLGDVLDSVARLPVWPLPTRFELQPVDVTDVAETLAEHATTGAHGRLDPVGGPEVLTAGDLARQYRRAKGVRRPVVRLPLPGRTARAFRSGTATCPDRQVGTVTWQTYLDRMVDASTDGGRATNAQTT